jgi:hypothetical protein
VPAAVANAVALVSIIVGLVFWAIVTFGRKINSALVTVYALRIVRATQKTAWLAAFGLTLTWCGSTWRCSASCPGSPAGT